MQSFNCVIVDDEPIARDIVNAYCAHIPALKVIASCTNALEAKKVIEENEVDILFLDINMPVLSGISFLRTLKFPPLIIFTTAYREYAVDAFDLAAVDYLLKPFSLERFIVAVDKATEKLSQPNAPKSEEIFIKADGRIYRIAATDIVFAEASGNYTKIHTTSGLIMPAMSFTAVVGLLTDQFIRVHRSYVINKDHLRLIEGNRLFVKDVEIPIGSNYKDEFVKRLGI
ncbi:MAG: DNA-binding response regulator [Flavitalea sp.]